MIAHSLYHKGLRVTALLLALLLVFQSGSLVPGTHDIARVVRMQVGQVVSMSAGVEPTELSIMTAELTKKQNELDKREASLAEREIAARVNRSDEQDRIFEYVLSAGLLLLLMLIILNYVFDFLRARRRVTGYGSVS